MGSGKRKRLEATVIAVQRKWGLNALRRAEAAPVVPHIPTGFIPLDAALTGLGGIPRGRITEVLGAPTSGKATLALKIVAKAQAEGDLAAYVDLAATFDPDYADRCGVKVSRLLLVRPQTGLEALEITRSLLAERAAGLILFDNVFDLLNPPADFPRLSANLRQLPQLLSRSRSALIFLTPLHPGQPLSETNYPGGFALPHYATLRLRLRREQWLHKHRDIRGYRAQVLILKNKLGQAGRRVKIAITFNGTVRGDGT